MNQKTNSYKPKFVKRVLKTSEEKAGFIFKDSKTFLEQIQTLPKESLKEYKNINEIKSAYK